MATGLRLGEALALRWQEVDMDRGTVTVKHTLRRDGKAWHLDRPKSHKGRRVVHVAPFAVDALRSHRARVGRERLAAGETWRESRVRVPASH